MPSYTPQHTYCSYVGGLVPWPAHLTPRVLIPDEKKSDLILPHVLNDGDVFFLTLDRRDRTSIATTIELLIGALDAMDDDIECEAECDDDECVDDFRCDKEDCGDDEPTMGSFCDSNGTGDQERWAWGQWGHADECEEENEHGGDVCDERHDQVDEDALEPFLGWSEEQSLYGCIATGNEFPHADGTTHFAGEGYQIGNDLLRSAGLRGVLVSPFLSEVARERLEIIAPGIIRVHSRH